MKAGGRLASRKEKHENLMNEFVSRRGWCSTSTGTRDDAASYLFLLILLVFLSALLLLQFPFQNYLLIIPYLVLLLVKLIVDLVVLLFDHFADSNLSTTSYSSYPSIPPWPWSPTTMTGLHKLWYPSVRDTSTWSKFGAHGEHGDVFLFSNLGALWFSENLIRYSLHVCLREVKTIFFPSNTLIYGISRDGSKNFNIRTCEHMILGQLRIVARQAKNAPLMGGSPLV